MIRGTRRTIVTAAASFAVVLGVGGVAAATSRHGAHRDSTAETSVAARAGRSATVLHRAASLDASSTTADSETSSTMDDDSSTTMEDTSSTTLGDNSTTTTLVGHEPGDDNAVDGVEDGNDHGAATEEAHENENAQLHEHEADATTTTLGIAAPQHADDNGTKSGTSDRSGRDGGGQDGRG